MVRRRTIEQWKPTEQESRQRFRGRIWAATVLAVQYFALKPRRLLGLAGLGAIGVGGFVAWRADASTPLIVIGAVLVVLGLVDWSESHASHAGTSLVLRRVSEAVAQVAQRKDVPQDAREELAEAAQDVAAAAEAGTGRGVPPAPLPRPSHRHISGGRLALQLSHGNVMFFRHRCLVTDPDGETTTAAPHRGLSFHPFVTPLEVIYPDDFEAAELPLATGTYRVRWQTQSTFSVVGGYRTVAAERFVIRRSAGNRQGN